MTGVQLRGSVLRGGLLICMGLLLGGSATVRTAVQNGMQLAIGSVIPSLFVFSVTADLIVRLEALRPASALLSPLYRRILRLPPDAASALLLGAAGGYPIGAQTVAALYEAGRLTRREAEYALGFSNNCGAAYLIAVVGPQLGLTTAKSVRLFGLHLLAAIIAAAVLRPFAMHGETASEHRSLPPSLANRDSLAVLLTGAVGRASLAMLRLCGWICLFSVATAFAERVQAGAAVGLLELSSGIAALGRNELTAGAFLTGFGGLCVACQTASFAAPHHLRMRWYWAGKLLQAFVAAALCRLLPVG